MMKKLSNWFSGGGYSFVVLAAVILVVFPLALDAFRLNLVGKYLTYGFVAVGLVMLWGWGGVLSLRPAPGLTPIRARGERNALFI